MVVVGGLRGGKTRRRDATVTVMHAPRNATRQIARSGCARYPATAALLSVRHSTLSVTILYPSLAKSPVFVAAPVAVFYTVTVQHVLDARDGCKTRLGVRDV